MLVCRSRAHVVRYARHLENGIRRLGYEWRVYASFSGTLALEDSPGELISEGTMNRGLSLQSADVFVVCNKLETGFDEPRLVAMYIDRSLSGAHCVQVLGRLNRVCEHKYNTSVVDFVNHATTIQQSFEQFWEETRFTTGPGHVLEIGERALDGYLANVLIHMGSLKHLSVGDALKRVAQMTADARANVETSLRAYVVQCRALQREKRELPMAWAERLLELLGVPDAAQEAKQKQSLSLEAAELDVSDTRLSETFNGSITMRRHCTGFPAAQAVVKGGHKARDGDLVTNRIGGKRSELKQGERSLVPTTLTLTLSPEHNAICKAN